MTCLLFHVHVFILNRPFIWILLSSYFMPSCWIAPSFYFILSSLIALSSCFILNPLVILFHAFILNHYYSLLHTIISFHASFLNHWFIQSHTFTPNHLFFLLYHFILNRSLITFGTFVLNPPFISIHAFILHHSSILDHIFIFNHPFNLFLAFIVNLSFILIMLSPWITLSFCVILSSQILPIICPCFHSTSLMHACRFIILLNRSLIPFHNSTIVHSFILNWSFITSSWLPFFIPLNQSSFRINASLSYQRLLSFHLIHFSSNCIYLPFAVISNRTDYYQIIAAILFFLQSDLLLFYYRTQVW